MATVKGHRCFSVPHVEWQGSGWVAFLPLQRRGEMLCQTSRKGSFKEALVKNEAAQERKVVWQSRSLPWVAGTQGQLQERDLCYLCLCSSAWHINPLNYQNPIQLHLTI